MSNLIGNTVKKVLRRTAAMQDRTVGIHIGKDEK